MSISTTPDIHTMLYPYRFTPDDKHRLALLIARGYLEAKHHAYQRAARTAAPYVRVRHPWQPSHHDAQQALQWATKQVDGIANTYHARLEAIAEQVLEDMQKDEPKQRGLIIGGVINAVAFAKGVAGGVKAFVEWKAPQIANVTEGTGAQDGTMQWIDDVQNSEIDAGDLVDGDVLAGLDNIQVQILPETSSSDFCADYAGNVYPLDNVDSLPVWPAHLGCPHHLEIVTK